MLRQRRSGEKVKIKMIQRTTSETIRLEKTEVLLVNNNPPIRAITATPLVKKYPTNSFQITGVSITPKTVEAGDDSADDFEESRTDDNSRLDNETPSLSEDTYSRDTEDFPPPPVLSDSNSTPIQVNNIANGLTLVPSSEDTTITNCNVKLDTEIALPIREIPIMASKKKPEDAVTSAEITLTASTFTNCSSGSGTPKTTTSTSTSNSPAVRTVGDRFKVVKTETIVPFRRGRWECMDYLDDSVHTPKDAYIYCNDRYVRASTLKKATRTQAKSTSSSSQAQSPSYQVSAFGERCPNLPAQTAPGFNLPQPAQMGDCQRQNSAPEPCYTPNYDFIRNQFIPQQQPQSLLQVAPHPTGFAAMSHQMSHPMYSASCPMLPQHPPAQSQAGGRQYAPLPSIRCVLPMFHPRVGQQTGFEMPPASQDYGYYSQGYSNPCSGYNQNSQPTMYNVMNQPVGGQAQPMYAANVQQCSEQYMSMPPTPTPTFVDLQLSVPPTIAPEPLQAQGIIQQVCITFIRGSYSRS